MKPLTPIILSLLAASSTYACEQMYVSPLAISKHHSGKGWNETHPGVTAECRYGVGYVMAGRVKNSLSRPLTFASVGGLMPIAPGIDLRLGAAVGAYDNGRNVVNFTAPVASLLILDGSIISAEITHIPAGGIVAAAATVVSVRMRLW